MALILYTFSRFDPGISKFTTNLFLSPTSIVELALILKFLGSGVKVRVQEIFVVH